MQPLQIILNVNINDLKGKLQAAPTPKPKPQPKPKKKPLKKAVGEAGEREQNANLTLRELINRGV